MGNSNHAQNKIFLNQWKQLQKQGVLGKQTNVWVRRDNNRVQMQQYSLHVTSQQQVDQQKNIHELRHNHPFLVSSLYFEDQTQAQFCSSDYKGKIYLQRIPLTLQSVTDIPFPDALHIYSQSLQGFHVIASQIQKGCFPLSQQLIGINSQGICKVWMNNQYDRNYPTSNNRITQSTMVRNIFEIIQENVDIQSLRNIPTPKDYIYSKSQSPSQVRFNQAVNLFRNYCNQFFNGQIPSRLQCVDKVGGAFNLSETWKNHYDQIQNFQKKPTGSIVQNNSIQNINENRIVRQQNRMVRQQIPVANTAPVLKSSQVYQNSNNEISFSKPAQNNLIYNSSTPSFNTVQSNNQPMRTSHMFINTVNNNILKENHTIPIRSIVTEIPRQQNNSVPINNAVVNNVPNNNINPQLHSQITRQIINNNPIHINNTNTNKNLIVQTIRPSPLFTQIRDQVEQQVTKNLNSSRINQNNNKLNQSRMKNQIINQNIVKKSNIIVSHNVVRQNVVIPVHPITNNNVMRGSRIIHVQNAPINQQKVKIPVQIRPSMTHINQNQIPVQVQRSIQVQGPIQVQVPVKIPVTSPVPVPTQVQVPVPVQVPIQIVKRSQVIQTISKIPSISRSQIQQQQQQHHHQQQQPQTPTSTQKRSSNILFVQSITTQVKNQQRNEPKASQFKTTPNQTQKVASKLVLMNQLISHPQSPPTIQIRDSNQDSISSITNVQTMQIRSNQQISDKFSQIRSQAIDMSTRNFYNNMMYNNVEMNNIIQQSNIQTNEYLTNQKQNNNNFNNINNVVQQSKSKKTLLEKNQKTYQFDFQKKNFALNSNKLTNVGLYDNGNDYSLGQQKQYKKYDYNADIYKPKQKARTSIYNVDLDDGMSSTAFLDSLKNMNFQTQNKSFKKTPNTYDYGLTTNSYNTSSSKLVNKGVQYGLNVDKNQYQNDLVIVGKKIEITPENIKQMNNNNQGYRVSYEYQQGQDLGGHIRYESELVVISNNNNNKAGSLSNNQIYNYNYQSYNNNNYGQVNEQEYGNYEQQTQNYESQFDRYAKYQQPAINTYQQKQNYFGDNLQTQYSRVNEQQYISKNDYSKYTANTTYQQQNTFNFSSPQRQEQYKVDFDPEILADLEKLKGTN